MVLESACIALNPRAQSSFATATREDDALGKRLEQYLVAPPAPINAEKQDYGRIEQAGKQQWTDRKARHPTKELATDRSIVLPYAIAENPNHFASRNALLHLQNGLWCAERNYAGSKMRRDRFQYPIGLGRVLEMHDDIYRSLVLGVSVCTQNLETAKVSTK